MKKSTKSSLTLIVILSLMSALSIVLGKYLAVNIGTVLRLSLENLPIIFSGIAFGPLCGAAVGLVSDLVGCLLVGYEINPIVTLGAVAIGLSSGIVAWIFSRTGYSRLWLTVALAELSAHLLGSVIIKTAGLSAYYDMPFIILVLWRLLNYVIIAIPEGALVYLLLKNPEIKREIGSIKSWGDRG